MDFRERNHYVPVWFQRRFLETGQDRYFYLDLQPETKHIDSNRTFTRKALLNWGPRKCFKVDNLYTTFLGDLKSDEIEECLFGRIDRAGSQAIDFFSTSYSVRDGLHDAFNGLLRYMDAQRFRTPRSLDWLKSLGKTSSHNMALFAMQEIMEFHGTMWVEGAWELVSCKNSETKFIISDNPVTFYNPKFFARSPKNKYPNDASLATLGTRTIFPLDKETCLIISHQQYLRDPWKNPLRDRINARGWSDTMFNLLDIQFGREVEELDVLRINYILKQRAARYIAAAKREWLYPEKMLQTKMWSKLDADWFLFPNLNLVSFSGGVVVGYKDGSSFAMDEYGRRRDDPNYQDKKQHNKESKTFRKAQKEWSKKREGKSESKTFMQGFRQGSLKP